MENIVNDKTRTIISILRAYIQSLKTVSIQTNGRIVNCIRTPKDSTCTAVGTKSVGELPSWAGLRHTVCSF